MYIFVFISILLLPFTIITTVISPNYSVWYLSQWLRGGFRPTGGGVFATCPTRGWGTWTSNRFCGKFSGVFFRKIRDSQLGKLRKFREETWGFQNDKGYFYRTLSLSKIYNNSFRRTYHVVFLRSKWVWGGSVPSFHLAVFEHGYSKRSCGEICNCFTWDMVKFGVFLGGSMLKCQ